MDLDRDPPIRLEKLLEVPLRIIKLDDLLLQEAKTNIMQGRKCHSAEPSLLRRRPGGSDEDRVPLLKRSLSTSCLLNCYTEPSQWKNTSAGISNKAHFKTETSALNLPEGTEAAIPVMLSEQDKLKKRNCFKADSLKMERDHIRGLSSPKSSPPGVILVGKVLENPKRYEELVEEDNAIIMDKEEKDTLKLTVYNDGRKESVKEYPTGLEPLRSINKMEDIDMEKRYFVNPEGLQMSRISRWDGSSSRGAFAGVGSGDDFGRRGDNRSLSLSSSNSSLSPANPIQGQRLTWEQCDNGLQISRCSNKSESEKLIDTHLQSYLTSLKYVKKPLPQAQTVPPGENLSPRGNLPKGMISQRGGLPLTSLPAPLTQGPEKFQQEIVDPWPERKIARVPTRPYLRKNVTFELPKEPVAVAIPTPAPTPPPTVPSVKRFRPSATATATITSSQEQQRFVNGNVVPHSTFIGKSYNSAGGSSPSPYLSPRSGITSYPNARVPQQFPPNQHNFKYNQNHNNNINNAGPYETIMSSIVGHDNNNQGDNNNSYLERLRRYWEFYSRSDMNMDKLNEYYEKYHFYPWEVLSARDEAIVREWRLRQEQETEQAPYRNTISGSGSITRGIPNAQRVPVPEQSPQNTHNQNQNRYYNNNTNNGQQYHAMQMQLFQQRMQQHARQSEQQRNYATAAPQPSPLQPHSWQSHVGPGKGLQLSTLQQCELQNVPNYQSAYNQLAAAARIYQGHQGHQRYPSPSMGMGGGFPEGQYNGNLQRQQAFEHALKNGNVVNAMHNGGRHLPQGRQQIGAPWTAGGGGMNQEHHHQRTAPSPIYPHQTSVIRRLQQQHSPTLPLALSYFQEQQQQRRGAHHIPEQYRYPNGEVAPMEGEGNKGVGVGVGVVMKRRRPTSVEMMNGTVPKSEERYQVLRATSPVPLVVGREEVVTAEEAVPTSAENEVVDEEATLDAHEVVEIEQGDQARVEGSGGGSAAGANETLGAWQYDHVVMLDKRTRTFMCKHCFESFREDGEGHNMRKHLYCKNLGNHVQCQVCLTLVPKDKLQRHLESHETYKPPADDLQIIRVVPNRRYQRGGHENS